MQNLEIGVRLDFDFSDLLRHVFLVLSHSVLDALLFPVFAQQCFVE